MYNNLGVCLRSKNLVDQAERAFKNGVKIFKKNKQRFVTDDQLKIFYNLARLSIDKGDSATLHQVSDYLLAIIPENAYAMYFKGAAFSLTDNFEEAKGFFEKSLALNKNIPELYPDYAFILETVTKDYQGAIKLLQGALKAGYGSLHLDNNLAFAYIQNGELNEAEKILAKYEANEVSGVLLATKGLLEIRKAKLEEGTELYRQAFEKLSGRNLKVARQILHCEIALYWLKKQNPKKADEELFQAKLLPKTYVSKYIAEIQALINKQL